MRVACRIVFIEFESELAVTKALEAFGEDRGKLLNLGKKVTVIAAERYPSTTAARTLCDAAIPDCAPIHCAIHCDGASI